MERGLLFLQPHGATAAPPVAWVWPFFLRLGASCLVLAKQLRRCENRRLVSVFSTSENELQSFLLGLSYCCQLHLFRVNSVFANKTQTKETNLTSQQSGSSYWHESVLYLRDKSCLVVRTVQEQLLPALTPILAFRKVPFPRLPAVYMMKTMLLSPPGEWCTYKHES